MTPLVSVIMTVRNGARFLPETLDAIAAQTFRRYELVVNDNGSTDETPDILAARARDDRRIRVLPSLGPGDRTFTQGVARAFCQAQAPFVAVNDADDVPAPTRLERQLALLEANPRIVTVGSWHEHIDEHSRVLGAHRVPEPVIEAYQLGNPVAHSSLMYRRDCAIAAGGYRERYTYASDYALQLAMLKAGGHIAIIPEPLVRIRSHEDQASRMKNARAQFYREPLEMMGIASRLSGVSFGARLRGMFARQRLALRYGHALWREGNIARCAADTPYWLLASLTSLLPRGKQAVEMRKS